MSVWECPACGHEYKCRPSKEHYEEFGWEFWCFGPEVIHGTKKNCELYKQHYIKYRNDDCHIPIRMECTDSKETSIYVTRGRRK